MEEKYYAYTPGRRTKFGPAAGVHPGEGSDSGSDRLFDPQARKKSKARRPSR